MDFTYNEIQQWLKSELLLNIAYKTEYSPGSLLSRSQTQSSSSQKHQTASRESISLKKKLPLALKFLQDEFWSGDRLRYMCQDETRLGLKTIARRLITAFGIKPIGLSQWQRDNFYLYGVVEPLSRYSFFYEFSHLDGDFFQRFLELLSAELGDDVVVI